MKARTEEFLYLLLWWTEMVTRPTFRNLSGSFEAWAYRNGLHRRLAELERRKLLESKPGAAVHGLGVLTDAGRVHALGGRDPEARWQRAWDGKWRMVVFDLPQSRNSERVRLRRFLRARGFGYLQNSVWVTPDPLNVASPGLAKAGQNVETLLTLEARPCSGESDDAIVNGAWDFEKINAGYRRYLAVLRDRTARSVRRSVTPASFSRWVQQERLAWMEAVSQDPLLPACLLPSGYMGEKAWKRRKQLLSRAAG